MIIAEHIEKSYQSNPVLRGVSITVSDGEFVSILGESGSGKSTLLSILAGNMRADRGRVLLDNVDLTALNEKELAKIRCEKLGFVYQSLNLLPTLSAKDNILLPTYLAKKGNAYGKERLEFLSERLEIKKLLSKLPSDMSGGERQRVAIARALVNEPSIIMLDEPTGSLDSRTAGEVLSLLCEINRQYGVSILMVTHSHDAAQIGDRIITVKDGKVVT